jgi:hypothetical protein
MIIMQLEFLSRKEVREVLFELMWGDRFEKDLIAKTASESEFNKIRDRLVEGEIVYQFRGENNTPYLSLTDKGVAIIDRIYEIERILEGEDIGTD